MNSLKILVAAVVIAVMLLFVVPFGSLHLYAALKTEAVRLGMSDAGAEQAASEFVIYGVGFSLFALVAAVAHTVKKDLFDV